MTDNNPLIPESEPLDKTVRFVTVAATVCILTLFGLMTTCTMHSNAYEADVKAQEAVIVAEKTKAIQIKANVDIEKIKSIEKMISDGANPIAIKCMDDGWLNDRTGTCVAVGVAVSKLSPDDTL